MSLPPLSHAPTPGTWREKRRLLLAILAVTLLYLGIQEIWLFGAAQLAYRGWTVNDPAETYAEQAALILEQSRLREAALPPNTAQRIFRLGFEYGYLSQWLGGYGKQEEALMRQLSRPVEVHLQRLEQLSLSLNVDPVAPLPVVTAADFSQLTRRIDSDAGGIAQRIEQIASPRLRHLFLLGAHIGIESAALDSSPNIPPIPASALIGQHATLAGIAPADWRPLARLSHGTPGEMAGSYRQSVAALDQSLLSSDGH